MSDSRERSEAPRGPVAGDVLAGGPVGSSAAPVPGSPLQHVPGSPVQRVPGSPGGCSEQRGPDSPGCFDDDEYEALRHTMGRFLAAERRLRGREGRPGGTLSSSHLRALFILVREPEATPGTLAKAADLNPASVTAMIDQLEAQGLVERRRDTHDRRSIQVSLTPAGRAKVEEKERYLRSRFREYFSDVTADELAAATKVLDRAASMMASMTEEPSEVRPG